ncbi:hypothetical protein K438DRAFT_1626610, partial [Mycena galopus ATCC 62051]
MRYIVPVIAGAVSKKFLKTIASLNSFFYHGQAPLLSEDVLQKMDNYLQNFHGNKQAIMDAGARRGKKGPIENWYFSLLTLFQSVVFNVRLNGAPLQWTADVTEHAHITLVKRPAANTNNHAHEEQIVRALDRQDKMRRFDLATAMTSAGVAFGTTISNSPGEDANVPEDTILDDEPPLLLNNTSELLARIEPVQRLSGTDRAVVDYFLESKLLAEGRFPNAPIPFRTFSSFEKKTAFHLSRDPSGPQLTIESAALKFGLPDFRPALASYLHRTHGPRIIIGGKRPTLDYLGVPFEKIEYWDKVRIQSCAFHDSQKILIPETVNAVPPNETWKRGRADAVIVNHDSQLEWPGGALQGRI